MSRDVRHLVIPALVLLAGPIVAQPPTPQQQADMLLNAARKGYNEGQYAFAREKFREYIAKFGNTPAINDARYGLGLALIEGSDRDFKAAYDTLAPLAGAKDFAQYPWVLYHLGLAQRGLGVNELAQAAAKPNEAPQRRNQANAHFAEAVKQFAAAAAAFAPLVKPVPEGSKDVPIEAEWSARARVDQAEMELRLLKPKEALVTAEVVTKDPVLTKTRYHALGLYYHGFAAFLTGDLMTAGRSLNQLAPFRDPVFGPHARYLLGRIHQAQGELAEAATQYEAVLADFERIKKEATAALQKDPLTNKPDERARLELAAKGPPPDHVARATFHLASLLYEAGKFGESLGKLSEFPKQFPNHPLLPETQLRVGFCQVQMRQYAEALKTLQPLANHPPLADQALLWLGKAQAGNFDPANPATKDAALKAAIATIRQAADRSAQMASADPTAKDRRAEALLELADTMQAANQPRDAAGVYQQLLGEKLLPNRVEELSQRLVTALHLAGDFAQSDAAATQFRQQFPNSPLLSAVAFRQAENAYFAARTVEQQGEKEKNAAKKAEAIKQYEEAAKRYAAVVEKFPEFERVNVARYGQALAYAKRGEYEKAKSALEAIPAPERSGELSKASYLLADCLLKLAPSNADDALAAGQLQEQLQGAAVLLEGFVAANPKEPEAADALFKLGYCHQKLAGLLAQPQEKTNALNTARGAYEKLIQQYAADPLMPTAVFERAKVLIAANDKGTASNELRRFTADPLAASRVAPLAVIQLATLLREQNKAEEAAQVLAASRQRHDAALAADPDRAEWAHLMRYHQGVALAEAGKYAEARQLLDQTTQQATGRPVAAEAALRSGQARLEEAHKLIDAARQKLATPGVTPQDQATANATITDGYNRIREAAKQLETAAESFKTALPTGEARARMLYDAAWAWRAVAEFEVTTTRNTMQQDALKKLTEEAAKKTPPGAKPPVILPPEIARTAIKLQPAEEKARAAYTGLISGFADSPLAVTGRFELAELLAEREEYDPAIKLLNEALDKEPPQELTDRIRLRLGTVLMAKQDFTAALTQFDALTRDPKNPLAGQAQYRAGECLLGLNEPAQAAARLAAFKDNPAFQNVPGVSDRALLRLGQALAQTKQWEPSRQALETLISRFGQSGWVNDARYGMGWALQNAGRFDEAVNVYQQVVAATATELAAKAQLQAGLCRLEQKRYGEAAASLLVVPFTYDFPELNAIALVEAARSLVELKQRDQAEKLLRRVIKEHGDGTWGKVAKERLEGLQSP